ncbi:MAG TPA: AEC family transporter [Candidatus Mediterraneibacter faecavium]|uniref:AEC family transporter n=1 Tax=Candidatus Mediterraneibacter faecavium TaxID=2838668 RepID=A0A9D2TMG7_9FIRM|nr:AEC family transporter [Candidatus Mediterraneibacter faecavium]
MFILIFEQLLKMFFIMVLAFVCFKIRLVDQNGNKTVSNLLLLVVNPILIITVYQTEYDPALVRGLLLAFAAAAATHVLGILISTLLIRPKAGADYSIERFNAMYSNCGFIGIPLIGSVLGDTGVFYLSAYMVMFNLFSWTHGVVLMEKKLSMKSLKDGLISPMFIATLTAVLLFFLRLKIPSVLLDSMNYIADMNTPLAMMVAGFSVAQADLGKMCRNLRLYYASAVKLIIFPLLTIPLLMLFHLPSEVSMTVLIAAACPSATTGTMMAIRYKQNYTYSSEIFSMTTIFAVVTMPLLVLIAEQVL